MRQIFIKVTLADFAQFKYCMICSATDMPCAYSKMECAVNDLTNVFRERDEMLNEFRDFIAKGNMMDMAVGIIIGAVFTAIVQSLIDDLINSIIGLFLGGADFTNLFVVTHGEGDFTTLDFAHEEGAAVFAYDQLIILFINSLIIS